MNDYDDNQLKQRFGAIIDSLRDMALDLKPRKYPGIAWQAPRKRSAWRGVVWPTAAGAVAAAILVAIFVLAGTLGKTTSVTPPPTYANALEPREDDLAVMEMLVADTLEIDWNYKLSAEDEYRWFMNEMPTSTPARDG